MRAVPLPQPFADRLAQKGECLVWQGCVGRDGYGHVRHKGKVVAAHRLAFELASGCAPNGHVLHSCDNPLCCNPAHLSVGTHRDNMQDCAQKGRNRVPRPGNGRTKLATADLDLIKRRFAAGGCTKSSLAREFGVTPTRIRQVLK
ncbi:HNH endonuclease [Paracoccus sp. NSM]|uniref:HNH endonuclease n=1 Tax=Paracoccus sp. NSM TaxID=3457784 RepID=UPI0040365572